MNVDCFSIKGRAHRINQDYCLAGDAKDNDFVRRCWPMKIESLASAPLAIVCDGCSSSKDTDIGARILAHCAKMYMYFGFDNSHFTNAAIRDAHHIVGQMNLARSCLNATLLAIKCVDDLFDIVIGGDGIIFANVDGQTQIIHYEFDSFDRRTGTKCGAPFYLSYTLNEEDEATYRKIFPGRVLRHLYAAGVKETKELPLKSFYEESFPIDRTKFVGVISDGADSIFKGNNKIPVEQVVNELVSFKNMNGEFVHRRAKRAMDAMYEQSMFNVDDLSIAAISQ